MPVHLRSQDDSFDHDGRYVLRDFGRWRPFSSFLPGIAGPLGVPLWAFYVNRGQAIASFGVQSKDNPIVEFEPANRAYQTTPITSFRTFVKLMHDADGEFYEPFAPWSVGDVTRMLIGINELEIEAHNSRHGLRTNILYFALPGEPFAGLVRQMTVTNVGTAPQHLEILDGLPRVMPYGVDNWGLKEIGRTLEAWMSVSNLDEGVPFYRFQASAADTEQVGEIEAGNFYLAFDEAGHVLLPFVDPVVVFDQNTSLCRPDGFLKQPLADLAQKRQITSGRTPCGFFGSRTTLAQGEATTLYAIVGHTGNLGLLQRQRQRLAQPAYVQQKLQQARVLVDQLTDVVATHSSSAAFDAYTRQTFLDNVLRGGWPLMFDDRPDIPYHIYSRKHGDLERDYNFFYLAAEPYSQGNASYRDVNQNRRCDVLLEPEVGDFNVTSFLSLIQADGYNPLSVEGSRFTLRTEQLADLRNLVQQPEKLVPLLASPFTPGELLQTVADKEIALKVAPEVMVNRILAQAEHHFQASFGEGYWSDHWTYNLDLIDTYLAVYPDRKRDLLFGERSISFFDSSAVVQPRNHKHVLLDDGRVRQYGAVKEDGEKAALIASRTESRNLMRTDHGHGEVYRTTVYAKLLGLALLKFATLDPLGMGIEMEAGKPGWYDALNGLPGLFGSSLCENYELERLLTFLLDAMPDQAHQVVDLPIEQVQLLEQVTAALQSWYESDDQDRDFRYWDVVSAARETYRASVRLGFDGKQSGHTLDQLAPVLESLRDKVRAGTERAVRMNDGIPPTYFAYSVVDYDLLTDAAGEPLRDEEGRPCVRAKCFEPTVLPLFLEGPVHALKAKPDRASARSLYDMIRESDLYDRKLGMYKVNTSLEGQSHEIGRARAFTPGWLENESIWLHMEYKYLLEVLKAGLYEEFFEDFKRALICFQDPEVYGRSPLENSSFLVSSAHPDESLHGAGFVARLSGATAEFLSIWSTMMAGHQPFFLRNGKLHLEFTPAIPGWLFDEDGRLTFTFLGQVPITYHNVNRRDLLPDNGRSAQRVELHLVDQSHIELTGGIIGEPYAQMVRAGRVANIDVHFRADVENPS